ncbi:MULTISPECIES: helix-turn-helix transcriptional regulator [Prauserella salsuginis group]|uniref:AraC-like DNA-binding protein n=2 Tax=Prauserella salsuginis group TaxID=2893672 RepID=A0A839XFN7_9PSEU|nr:MULTISPECIES: AraC family transcriptional regulator [Prauserella salsuginis group]MBB3662080.1 AraC-like DNA-binding protein [Prauserella sediminis]MCR3719772.1 AraC-type DNA-binding protein [Prauserella flava]MCR3736685.1 AraC-type DNA-binding protein [Prauserella salsuginis]
MGEFRRSTAVPHLEVRRSCRENTCYRPHFHDTFSIGLIDNGSSVFTGSSAGTIRLQPGDVVVIPAGQVHACNPGEGPWLYRMAHMDQEWAVSLVPRCAAHRLLSGVGVLRRDDLHDRIAAAMQVVFADQPSAHIEAEFAAALGDLAAATPEHLVPSGTDATLRTRLRPVMDRLRRDEANPQLDELAQLVGMTRYELVRAMRRATGLAPLAWRQNARIVRARHLLRSGLPIADTAQALGFTDQSHFHRVFRAHVAASPGVYRG